MTVFWNHSALVKFDVSQQSIVIVEPPRTGNDLLDDEFWILFVVIHD